MDWKAITAGGQRKGEMGLVSDVHRQAGEGGVRHTGWPTDTLKSEL